MKTKNIPQVILLAVSLLGIDSRATAFFDQNFDGAPYTDNLQFTNDPGNPAVGIGKLDQGAWYVINGDIRTSTAQALSPTRSMGLHFDDLQSGGQIVGLFTNSTNTAYEATTQGLSAKFAFSLDNSSQQINFIIRSQGEVTMAYLALGGGSGLAGAYFDNAYTSFEYELARDTWYNIEVILPADPGPLANNYLVRLYDASGQTQLGNTLSGEFAGGIAAENYYYFSLSGGAYAGGENTAYFDNISVVAIPEPASISLMALGTIGLYVLARRKKRALLP